MYHMYVPSSTRSMRQAKHYHKHLLPKCLHSMGFSIPQAKVHQPHEVRKHSIAGEDAKYRVI